MERLGINALCISYGTVKPRRSVHYLNGKWVNSVLFIQDSIGIRGDSIHMVTCVV